MSGFSQICTEGKLRRREMAAVVVADIFMQNRGRRVKRALQTTVRQAPSFAESARLVLRDDSTGRIKSSRRAKSPRPQAEAGTVFRAICPLP